MQPASTAGNCFFLLLHTPAGGKVKLKWDKKRWRLEGKSAQFGSNIILMKTKSHCRVVCQLREQKLAYNNSTAAMRMHIRLRHLDVNLQEEQQHSAVKHYNICHPTHRRCADRSEKITQLVSEMTARDMLPMLLCLVEGKGFGTLMHHI